ncbi:MAG TPA: CHAT domain-containing tetratricopeptide repeat protein [Paludibaculum sp.]
MILLLAPGLCAADDPLVLNREGAKLLYTGEYEKALDAFERSRLLHHERGERQLEAERWVNIGAIHFYQGRYLQAWATYTQASALVQDKDTWAADVRQLIDMNRAALLQKLGRDQDALEIYQRVRRSAHVISAAERAQMLSNLGALYRRLGDPYKAIDSEREALGVFQQEKDRDGELGAAKNIAIAQALDFQDYGAARAGFTQVLALALKAGNRREALQARLYLGETHFRDGRRAQAEAEWAIALALARELKAPEEEWKALYGLGRVRDERALLEEAAGVIEASRAKLGRSVLRNGFLADKRDVYDALIERARGDDEWVSWLERSRGRGLVRLAELRRNLPEDAALLVFWAGRSAGRLRWFTREHSGGAPLRWNRRGQPDTAWLSSAPAARRWIIVPDGVLAGVAFDALPVSSAERVIERHETWLLPSVAALQSPAPSRAGWRWPWQSQMLGIGDPETGALLPGDERWTRLPRAGQELAAAAQYLDGRSRLLERGAARKQALQSAHGYPLLHLATHASADYESPARSRILFAGPEYLYLREVAELNLRSVDLVTLSACETAAGALARGDAPMSLSRAFLDAGAAATVGSLWVVRDEAALIFTQLFYRALGGGAGKAAALRAAKLAMLRRGMPENDWAAFVLTGNGAEPIEPFVSWTQLLAAASVLLITAGLWLTRRR